MRAEAKNSRIFYRNRFSNFATWLITAFGALYFFMATIESITETEPAAFLIGFNFVFMVGFLGPALREPFHGVVVTSSEVRVRNIWRTHVLSWDEIERFSLEKYDPWPRIGVAILKSGRRVPMAGVQYALATHFAQNTVAALNERLTIMHGDQVTSSEPADEYPSQRSIPSG